MARIELHTKIRLVRLAHVHYTHADIDRAHQFLLDFGFQQIDRRGGRTFYRGYGTEPFVYCASEGERAEFGGLAFVVESLQDLELAADTLPGATAIYKNDAPGGGQAVTFHDPVDGFPFHLIHGQEAADPLADYPELSFNFPRHKQRPVSHFQRLQQGPAPVCDLCNHFQ